MKASLYKYTGFARRANFYLPKRYNLFLFTRATNKV